MTVKEGSSSKRSSVYASALGFFLSMVGMELALEGVNDAFPDLVALPYAVTLFQFGCCFALPIILSKGTSLETFPKSFVEVLPYISLTMAVFGGTFLATLSVRYVSYPTKVVFKSAKLIPTMIVASFWNTSSDKNGKRNTYGTLEYLSASLVCAGAAGYGLDSGGGSSGNDSLLTSASYFGIGCLLCSIFCDAFTPNLQQLLMAPAAPTTTTTGRTSSETPGLLPTTTAPIIAYNNDLGRGHRLGLCIKRLFPTTGMGLSAGELMTNANGVGFAFLVVGMSVNGTLLEAVQVSVHHPVLAAYLLGIGMALSLAVLCYTTLIREAGSVVAVAVATLRKVATVVLSYLVYPKPLSSRHIASGIVVLAGILLSNHAKQQRKQEQRKG